MQDDPTDARLLDFVESDGEPMGETDLHVEQIVYLRLALRHLTRERQRDDTAQVNSNLIVYWDPEDARKRLTPDVFLVRGLSDARRRRRTWRLWDEGRAPDLIVEVASRSTYELDLGPKREVYRDVFRTTEYLVFDPEGFMQPGPLVGWRLGPQGYRRAGTSTRFESQVARATFQVIDGALRIVDTTGAVVPGDPEGGARDLVRRLLAGRFGDVPAAAALVVSGLSDADLASAAQDAATVPTLDAWLDRWRPRG